MPTATSVVLHKINYKCRSLQFPWEGPVLVKVPWNLCVIRFPLNLPLERDFASLIGIICLAYEIIVWRSWGVGPRLISKDFGSNYYTFIYTSYTHICTYMQNICQIPMTKVCCYNIDSHRIFNKGSYKVCLLVCNSVMK